MTAQKAYDLAFEYAEEHLDGRCIDDLKEMYDDLADWFREKGGTKEEYYLFQDIVHAWVRNKIELAMADAYMGMPDWE